MKHPHAFLMVLAILFTSTFSGHTAARLVDNGDGTVTDTDSHLMWVQHVEYNKDTWADANTWADDLALGHNEFWGEWPWGWVTARDWRLPTLDELEQLRTHLGGLVGTPLTDVTPFVFQSYADPYRIWTSTPGSIPVTKAAGVNFWDGQTEEWLRGSTLHRIAVRSIDRGYIAQVSAIVSLFGIIILVVYFVLRRRKMSPREP